MSQPRSNFLSGFLVKQAGSQLNSGSAPAAKTCQRQAEQADLIPVRRSDRRPKPQNLELLFFSETGKIPVSLSTDRIKFQWSLMNVFRMRKQLPSQLFTGFCFLSVHGEKDFVASAERFVNKASANQNCYGDNFNCYNNINCHHNNYSCNLNN